MTQVTISIRPAGAANLHDTDLRLADLAGALITDQQLASTVSLEGAILPDGSTHQ